MHNLYPLFIGVFALIFIIVRAKEHKARVADANKTFAHMGASDVATRLGLEVTEGDPSLNLMMLHHSHVSDDAAVRSGGGLLDPTVHGKNHGVTLRGTPQGRAQAFTYSLDTETESYALSTKWKRTLRFALTTEVRAPFPDFEVMLRNPNVYLKPKPVFMFPAHATGVPEVDSALVVYSNDARIAHLIGPLLIPIVGHTFVHVVGRGQRLELLADHATSSYATYFLEENASLHHAIADAIERFTAS